MKTNKFIEKSRILCRIWIVFGGIWIVWMWLQWLIGFEKVGYSNIGKGGFAEMFMDLFSMVLLGSFCVANGWKIYKLLEEHEDFARYFSKDSNICKNLEIAKKLLFLIIGFSGFSWLSGFIAVLDIISIFALFLVMLLYTHYLRQLQESVE